MKEDAQRELSLYFDPLAPQLASLPYKLSGPSEPLPAQDARAVYAQCLLDCKSLLIGRANDLQNQFDEVRQLPNLLLN